MSWLWWNPIGFAVTFVVTAALARPRFVRPAVVWPRIEGRWLLGTTAAIVSCLAAVTIGW